MGAQLQSGGEPMQKGGLVQRLGVLAEVAGVPTETQAPVQVGRLKTRAVLGLTKES